MDKTDAQWKSELSATEYQILRKEGTEASFSHPHNKEYRKGIFACVACSTPLFTSDMKFDSGTGWPSFYECIEGAFEEKTDRKFS